MKLNKLHLLLLLVSLLVFSNFGTSVMEGMKNRNKQHKPKKNSDFQDILKRVDKLTSQFGGSKPSKNHVKHAAQQAHHAQHAKQAHFEKQQHAQPHKMPSHEDFVSKKEIPEGNEDLYILKSKIVPPVCPKCPDVSVCPKSKGGSGKKCPPCPPCGRCPVAPFECKKVPTYASSTRDYLPNFFYGSMMGGSTTGYGLPRPVLNDFSKFS